LFLILDFLRLLKKEEYHGVFRPRKFAVVAPVIFICFVFEVCPLRISTALFGTLNVSPEFLSIPHLPRRQPAAILI
jgi:hypothetical protein